MCPVAERVEVARGVGLALERQVRSVDDVGAEALDLYDAGVDESDADPAAGDAAGIELVGPDDGSHVVEARLGVVVDPAGRTEQAAQGAAQQGGDAAEQAAEQSAAGLGRGRSRRSNEQDDADRPDSETAHRGATGHDPPKAVMALPTSVLSGYLTW